VFDAGSIEAIKRQLEAVQLELEVRTAATIPDGGRYRPLTGDEWIEKRKPLSAKSTMNE
jgi:hypothetical protein